MYVMEISSASFIRSASGKAIRVETAVTQCHYRCPNLGINKVQRRRKNLKKCYKT